MHVIITKVITKRVVKEYVFDKLNWENKNFLNQKREERELNQYEIKETHRKQIILLLMIKSVLIR